MLRNPKPFLILAGASLVGFPVFALLHNLFYALGVAIGNVPVASPLLNSLDAGSFLIALFLCPAGLVLGVLGASAAAVWRRVREN